MITEKEIFSSTAGTNENSSGQLMRRYNSLTVSHGFPIPLILLAEPDVHGRGKFEIIDGIQRLNAVFTFIENAFAYHDKYFDVAEFARAKQAAEDKLFQPVSGQPLLTRRECANLLDYQLAVTIYPTTEESNITEVFGRINSGGRQLSYQDQRQAGVITEFARLVRVLASEIRGDVSKDLLLLSEMPEISVDTAKEPHGYGIQAEQTFWCRQGILSVKQLKESEDEQTIADFAASVLREEPFPFSKELLDKLYDRPTDEAKDIERRLTAYGVERLSKEIKSTFSVLKHVIESCDLAQNFLRSRVRPGTFYPIKAPFYAIFMAFFDLIVTQKKSPDQPKRIMDALEGLDQKLTKGAHYETTENRRQNINLTKGLIQDFFVNRVPPVLGHGPSLVIDFENALRRSRIETPRYEFKQGILRLDADRKIDNELLQRLPETACGIANLGPDSDGYIFIGVADREAHAQRIQAIDGVAAQRVADHFVVGIEREAAILRVSLEEYVKRIIATFQTAELTEPLKTQILSGFDTITVYGLTVIRARIPPQRDVSFVSGHAFYRENSSTVEIKGPQLLAVSKLFNK